jgi:hypothetical protein
VVRLQLFAAFVEADSFSTTVSQKRGFDDLTVGDTAWNYLLLLNGLMAALTESFLAVRAAGVSLSTLLYFLFSRFSLD